MIERSEYIKGFDELTPVHKDIHNGIYLKREDLFRPYEDIDIRGDKIRQHYALISNNKDNIINECDGNVFVPLFTSSCQSAVIARVIEDIDSGIHLTVFHGRCTKESIMKNKVALNAILHKASINLEARAGYFSVINATMNKKKDKGIKFFNASLEENVLEYPNEVLYTIAYQTQNLPDLDVLYVPLGSGLTVTGVLLGIDKYKLNIKKVIGTSVSNISEVKKKYINDIFEKVSNKEIETDFECIDCGFDYHKKVSQSLHINHEIVKFDSIYEAKSCVAMLKHMDTSKKNGFWVSGNMDGIRNNVFGIKDIVKETNI